MKKVIPFILVAMMAISACKKEEAKEVIPEVPVIPVDTVKREKVIEITTSYGTMYMWLFKETPLHKANYLKLAGEGFFDNTTYHRIIPGFMIQGGDPYSKDSDPKNDGQGGPGYTLPAEFVDTLKNKRGYVAAARLGDAQNPLKASSGSQFYINVVHNTSLDGKYTVFGYIMQGIAVADSIVKQPRDVNDRPLTDIKMQVKILEKTAAEIETQFGYVVK